MATQVASLYGLLDLRDDGFRRGLRDAESGLDGLASGLRRTEQTLGTIGRTMTTRLTAPVVAGMGLMVNRAMAFDNAMINAQAVLGNTTDEMQAINAEVLRIGANSTAGAQAAAGAFYDIASGVQDASTHMAILEAAIATSEAGQADLGATTNALVATMNSYRFAADDAAYVSDVFTRTVGMGVLTMEQLASAMPQVTNLANTLGIEFDTLGGFMAFITTQGATASAAATQLRGVMSALMNPTTALQTAIEALGYQTGEAMINAEGLDGALNLIREYGGGSFAGLITGQEALMGALALTGEGASEFFDTFAEGVDGATDAARAIQLESLTAQMTILRNQIEGVAIRLGLILIPLLQELAQEVKPVVENLIAWIDANQDVVRDMMKVVGVIALAGPILWALSKLIGIVATGVKILGVLFAALTSPIWLTVAAGVALGLAIYNLMKHFGIIDAFRDVVVSAFDIIRATIDRVIALITSIPRLIGEAANAVASMAGQASVTTDLIVSGSPLAQQTAAMQRQLTARGGVDVRGSNLFYASGRAGGGSVQAGQPYTVGERGREMFIPQTSGRIASAEEIGNGGGDNYYVTINANDYAGGRAAADGFEQRLQAYRRKRG